MKTTTRNLEDAIIRTVRRMYKDAKGEESVVAAIAHCDNCGELYNLYNPHLDQDNDDLTMCAGCTLNDLMEVYEAGSNHESAH